MKHFVGGLSEADRASSSQRSIGFGDASHGASIDIDYDELLEPITNHCGFNFMPVPAVAAATASLKDTGLVAERRRINATIRQETFDWLDRNHYTYIPSESNCFLLDTQRPGKETIKAMAQQNVFVGRVWPLLPTYVRITVGTRENSNARRNRGNLLS